MQIKTRNCKANRNKKKLFNDVKLHNNIKGYTVTLMYKVTHTQPHYVTHIENCLQNINLNYLQNTENGKHEFTTYGVCTGKGTHMTHVYFPMVSFPST